MTPEEQEYAEYQEYLAYLNASEATQKPQGTDLFSTTAANTFNSLASATEIDPGANPFGQAGIDLTKQRAGEQVGKFALETGVPLAAGAASGPVIGATQGLPLLGRAAGYAASGLLDAGINYAGQKIEQDIGLASPTTGKQDFDSALTTAAVDFAVPSVAEVGVGALRGTSGLVNDPKALGRYWGATANDANRAITRKTPDQAISELMENPEFKSQVVGNASVNRAFDNLQEMKAATGADIGARYKEAGNLSIDSQSILSDPRITNLTAQLQNPYALGSSKKMISPVLDDVLPILQQFPEHSIANLWQVRRQIDDSINFARKTKDLSYDQATAQQLRNVLSDHITAAIERTGVKDLVDLNQRYNNLSIVEIPLGKRSGQMSDNNFIGYDITQLGKMGAYLKGSAGYAAGDALLPGSGLIAGALAPVVAGNPGRAALFNVAEASQGIPSGVGMLTAMTTNMPIPRSQDLPRSWKAVKTDSMHLSNLEAIAATLGLLPPGTNLADLPDAVGKQILGAIATQVPGVFEKVPDKINVIDGQFMDPTGKSVVVNDAINMPAEERAKRIGGVWNNQYVPPSQQPKAQPTPLPALPVTIDRATEALTSGLTPSSNVPLDLSYDNATTRTLEQLTEAQSLHALN